MALGNNDTRTIYYKISFTLRINSAIESYRDQTTGYSGPVAGGL